MMLGWWFLHHFIGTIDSTIPGWRRWPHEFSSLGSGLSLRHSSIFSAKKWNTYIKMMKMIKQFRVDIYIYMFPSYHYHDISPRISSFFFSSNPSCIRWSGPNGYSKLTDFGFAKIVEPGERNRSRSRGKNMGGFRDWYPQKWMVDFHGKIHL